MSLFFRRSTITENDILEEVVLTSKTHDAFLTASTQRSTFENWLFEHSILRYGDDVRIPTKVFAANANLSLEGSFYAYKVDLTLPGQQGMTKPTTRIVVVAPHSLTPESSLHDQNDSQENLEITESFLVSLTAPRPDNLGSLDVEPLTSPIDARCDDVSLHTRTSDLRSLGVLNGDWVRLY